MNNRRIFLKQAGVIGVASVLPFNSLLANDKKNKMTDTKTRWSDGSRLVVSISMQFEAGGQPANSESPFPQNLEKGFIDLPAATWYQYGYKEGIPRMLDNWDELGVKVTSHMVGTAVLKNPQLAKEIVARGHEAAAHGMNWSTQYNLSYEAEKKFIKYCADDIKIVTVATPIGYNPN